MHLDELEVRGFGKLKGLTVTLIDGMNIIYGCNEAGKSTLQWFIKGMLYGLKSGRQRLNGLGAPQKRFKPWDGSPYSGALIYTLDDGKSFRVERNFDTGIVRVFDSSYGNITDSFEIGRDKLPMFAQQHMGMDERTFERTAFIRQMKIRLDEDSSVALASKLSNVSGTGFEEISFLSAEKALSDALKNHIGTSRTRIQPLDKLEARLKQLAGERDRLLKEQSRRICAQEEMLEARTLYNRLEIQERYLKHISGLIDIRKELDANLIKEAELKETARKMKELESELSDKQADSLQEDLPLKRARGRTNTATDKRRQIREGIVTPVLCLAAAILFAILIVHSAITTDIRRNWILPVIYSACMLVSCVAGVVFLKRRSVTKDNQNQSQSQNRNQSEIWSQNRNQSEIWSQNRNQQNPGCVQQNSELQKISLRLEELSEKLELGIDAALKMDGSHTGDFCNENLDIKIYDSDTVSLETAWDVEMEQVKEELFETAMREKYCEGLLKDNGESIEELQGVEEETVAVKEKIAYLKYKRKALVLARDVLMDAGHEIRQTFTPDINKSMGEIISGLTAGRYTDLRGNDRLSLRVSAPEDGNVKNVLELSGATADQAYLALRLAMSQVLSSGTEALPLIMDEAFSQFDDKRTALALKYLHKVYDKQIILFTCKQREVELAHEIFGDDMNLVELGCEISEQA